jgi:hypothetical protein
MPGNIKPNNNNMWKINKSEGLSDPTTVSAIGSSLGTSGTVDLDVVSLHDSYQVINLTGNITFTASNKSAGQTLTIKLVAGESNRNLTFPSWTFVGAVAPTSLAANKVAVLSVTYFDETDSAAIAAYAAQP